MIIFTPNTVIRSTEINSNFDGLADGTEINDGAINQLKIYNPYKFHAYRNGNVTMSAGKINLNAELFDTNGNFDTVTNYRYNVPVTGYYWISFSVINNVNAGTGYYATVRLNGADAIIGSRDIASYTNPDGWNGSVGSALIYLTSGQYLELQYQGDSRTIYGYYNQTFMSGFLVSTA